MISRRLSRGFRAGLLFFAFGLAALPAAVLQSKEPQAGGRLAIDTIMKGEDFVGSPPTGLAWAIDGKTLYFRWKKPGDKEAGYYAVTTANKVPRKVAPEEFLKLPPLPAQAATSPIRFYLRGGNFGPAMELDKARKRALVVQGGDLFLVDLTKGTTSRLTATDEPESNPKFASDPNKIIFSSGDNLFLLSLSEGSLRQMTSFTRKSPPPDAKKPGEIEKWYEEEQKALFKEFQKSPEKFPGTRDILPPLDKSSPRKPFPLLEGQRAVALELSPDMKSVTFALVQNRDESAGTIVPRYVTRSGYTETSDSHAKAASPSWDLKAGVMDVATGDVKWIDFGLTGRKVFPGGAIWSPDGKLCVITSTSEDRKDAWLFLLDPATALTTAIEHVHNEAWTGPLGLTGVFWWPDNRHLGYISEKDGYAHLYKASIDGKDIRQLTSGKFEVTEATLSANGKRLYLVTNEEHPGETHFYWMNAEGGARTRITSPTGQNDVALSPDESTLAFLNSYSNRPPEVYLQANAPMAAATRITQSTTAEFQAYPWYDPEVLTIKARDGVDIYARLYTPVVRHPSRPAVIFIHGAGYLQNAHKGWSSYFREYMFHNFLMEQGYVVLDVDYRGSAGYGRDFRTGIYRHMGGKDLDDIVDAAKFLSEKMDVDPGRIGCYGGSYGGFLTLMAMFKDGDIFRAGAALRPVTDWAHYHAGYTVDILNLPQGDPEAYKQSSPIYFAEGLKGALLICHGMVDENVHFQDTVRLIQRLIELGKDNWQVAPYPVEDHAFHNPSSWVDEYKRIFRLFEQNLK
jgi:dipeptidyl aminopeptidase/acylaminoacyl peptidase